MKTFVCKRCSNEIEVEPGGYRKSFCVPCALKQARQHDVASAARLKINAQSARGVLNKSEKSRQFALRMAAIAPYTRSETAELLGVSSEQVRQDEISIIMKIRKNCSALAAECGFRDGIVFGKPK